MTRFPTPPAYVLQTATRHHGVSVGSQCTRLLRGRFGAGAASAAAAGCGCCTSSCSSIAAPSRFRASCAQIRITAPNLRVALRRYQRVARSPRCAHPLRQHRTPGKNRCPFSSSSTGTFPSRPHRRIVSGVRCTPYFSNKRLENRELVNRKSVVLIAGYGTTIAGSRQGGFSEVGRWWRYFVERERCGGVL